MELFDTHAHYNDEKFDGDREKVIDDVYQYGVTRLVNAGYSLQSSKRALEIAKRYSWMFTICGISPNDIPDSKEKIDSQVKELKRFILDNDEEIQNRQLSQKGKVNQTVDIVNNNKGNISQTVNKSRKIVGIGEIGLDYYWNKENRELQQYAFIQQIQTANELDLPIVIHTRDAVDDTIDILKNQIQAQKKGIFHCCPLNRELVKQALNMGFYISFAGPITFKNSRNADEIIGMVPLEKVLIETDSPYLSPEPHRGTRNDSRNVYFVVEKIAKAKNINIEEIAQKTYQNAMKVFEIA